MYVEVWEFDKKVDIYGMNIRRQGNNKEEDYLAMNRNFRKDVPRGVLFNTSTCRISSTLAKSPILPSLAAQE